ncbi:hypothetical protein GGS20DRAFT_372730 [Poronia punctata]|nr:hypothetical protein GGS20DRAFT_372730 [Poronia punctata]
MATRLPCALPRRPTASFTLNPLNTHTCTAYQAPSHTPLSHTPSRAATLIKRPRRPYTFTQLVQLTDGSTYTMRTCSPIGVYKSAKDTRNHMLWNPKEKSLQDVEVDEAGKLAAFRGRFGRGWDADATAEESESQGAAATPADSVAAGKGKKDSAAAADKNKSAEDALGDLIAGYAIDMDNLPAAPLSGSKKKK